MLCKYCQLAVLMVNGSLYVVMILLVVLLKSVLPPVTRRLEEDEATVTAWDVEKYFYSC